MTVGSHEGRPVGLKVGTLGVGVGYLVGAWGVFGEYVGLCFHKSHPPLCRRLDTCLGTSVGISVGGEDGSFAKIINCASSFVVAFPLESFVETVVVVSSEDPQVVDRIPQSSNAMNM